jgi:nucleolar protein 56
VPDQAVLPALRAHRPSLVQPSACPPSLPARSALKTKGNTPKYGLIFHSSFIGRAKARNKGRISRYLANKCSIASRIDCFMDTATSAFGEKLKDQVEERLRFYEDGVAPRKNITVMQVRHTAWSADELRAHRCWDEA